MKHAFALSACLVAILLAGCGGSSSTSSGSGSQTDHTAPAGMWGGALVSNAAQPATLTLTTGGGQFVFPCGQTATVSQPILPDSSGNFSAAGTTTFGLFTAVGQNAAQPTQFTGNVTNHVMTVTLKVTPATGTSSTLGPYSVTLGQTAPTFQGACPG